MISVLINNHNYGEFIGEAIESVLNQSYKDFEIVIVDGDSTDNSREIIMSYVEKFPKIITAVFKPTSGQAAAFNVGYKLCRGDILAFLDSDDYFLENKLEKIAKWHQEYDFIGHSRTLHGADGKLKSTDTVVDVYEERSKLLKKYGFIYTYGLITSCCSMTRKMADLIFPMPEDGYITFADCYVKVLAQYYGNIKFFEEPLSYYRVHQKQDSKSFGDSKKLEEFGEELYKRVFRDINKKLINENEDPIPELTENNLKEAFKLANPNIKISNKTPLTIYGTGAYSHKAYRCIKVLGGEFLFAIDSDKNMWGKKWNGVEIVSLEEALDRKDQFKFIVIGSSNYVQEIKDILLRKGLHENKDFKEVVCPND